jgi:uncharacterized protein
MDINGKENNNSRKTYRILSLDGGGIRGLITAVWLDRLEQTLEKPLRDHFNLIAGTSTGSILACGISMGIPASDLIHIYKKRGKEIFPPLFSSPRILKFLKHLPTQGLNQQLYSDQGLKKVLQEEFKWEKIKECNSNRNSYNNEGDALFENIRLLNEKNGRSLTTLVTSYDTLNRKVVIFDSRKDKYDKIPVWEICKASSSAPIFFPAHIMKMKNDNKESYEIPLIDGGVVASNPTACALAEGMKETNKKLNLNQFVVVSLGTGDANRSISIKKAKNWGITDWSYQITNVLFDGVSQAMDHIATNMLDSEKYFRFQAKLDRDNLDDVSEENINALQAFANCYFETHEWQKKIDKLKCLLENSEKVPVDKKAVNNFSCEQNFPELYNCATRL